MKTPKTPANDPSAYDLDIWAYKAEIPNKIIDYLKSLNIFTQESLVHYYIQNSVKLQDHLKNLEDFETEMVILGLESLKEEYLGMMDVEETGEENDQEKQDREKEEVIFNDQREENRNLDDEVTNSSVIDQGDNLLSNSMETHDTNPVLAEPFISISLVESSCNKLPFSSLEESSSEEEFVKHRRKILKRESREICQNPLREQGIRIKKRHRRGIRHHRKEHTRNLSLLSSSPSFNSTLNPEDARNEIELSEQNRALADLGKDEFPIRDDLFEAKKDITAVVHGSELILPSSLIPPASSSPETIPDEINLDPVVPANSTLQHEIESSLSPQQEIDIPQIRLTEDLLNWIKNAPPLPIDLQKELEGNNILSFDSLSEVIRSGENHEKYHVIQKMRSNLKPIPKKKFDNYVSQSFPSLTSNLVKTAILPDTQSVSLLTVETVPSGINAQMSSVSCDAFNHYSQALNSDSHMMVHESINTPYILHHNLKSLGPRTLNVITQAIRSPEEEEIEEAIQYAEKLPEGGEIVITEAEKERSIEELKKEIDLENDFINQINDITTNVDSDLVLSSAAKEVLNQSKTNHQLRAKRLKRLIMEKKKQSHYSTQPSVELKHEVNSLVQLQEEKVTETKVSSSNELSQTFVVKDMIDVYQCHGMNVVFSRIVKIREAKAAVVGLLGIEDLDKVRLKGESLPPVVSFLITFFYFQRKSESKHCKERKSKRKRIEEIKVN